MILYELIKRSANALNLSAALIGTPPIFNVDLKVVFLGEVPDDYIEIEIMVSKGNMGWLYSQANIVIYRRKATMYECSLTKLKELTETKLKEKKFSDEPKIDHLSRSVDGRIVTRLSIEYVLGISNLID